MSSPQQYYQRQIILPEISEEGQKKLDNAKVIVVGAGGLGSPLLTYLTAAGIGEIHIYDFDNVEVTNLHRQVLFTPETVGKNKAKIAAEVLTKKNPHIKVLGYPERFDENVSLDNVDIIIDCSDNFNTKFMVHDLCFKNKVNFCLASIHKFEGQIQLFNFKKEKSQCLRCLWPQEPDATCVQTCSEAGVLGATAGIIGTIQAMEVLKLFLGLPTLQNNQNLMINLLSFETFRLNVTPDLNCPMCGESPRAVTSPASSLEISYEEYLNGKYTSVAVTNISRNFDIISSLTTILQDVEKLKKDQALAIFCQKGITSLKAAKLLSQNGFTHAYSVKGGINMIQSKYP